MQDAVVDRLDALIAVSERIADALEELRDEVRNVDSNVSLMQADVSTIDDYAHSIKLAIGSIETDVSGIHIAMP